MGVHVGLAACALTVRQIPPFGAPANITFGLFAIGASAEIAPLTGLLPATFTACPFTIAAGPASLHVGVGFSVIRGGGGGIGTTGTFGSPGKLK